MKNNFKISIIIPCYNVGKYLSQCINSIINQTYTNLEIITINDGSTDETLEILNSFQTKDSRLKIINQENQGLSGARNAGIDFATGEYLMFVDSDDWLNLTTIQIVVDQLNHQPLDVVMFSYVKEYGNISKNQYILNKNQFFDTDGCAYLHQRIIGLNDTDLANPEQADTLVTAWGKLYKSAIIQKNNIKFIDCKIVGSEDILFSTACFFYVKNAFYVNQCLYHYRKNNSSSMTTAYRPKIIFQFPVLYDFLEKFILEKNLTNNYRQAYNNRVSMSIVALGLNEICSNASFFKKYHNIKSIISSKKYKESISQFQINEVPFYWKIFYYFCKIKFIIGVYVLLLCISKIINRNG